MANVYNFFKFLKDKANRDLPFKLKLAIAPELINEKDLHIKGNLDLQNSNTVVLPDNLYIESAFYLDYTPIKTLPKNLKVGKNLSLVDTNVETLPADLEVGGYLHIARTPLAEKYRDKFSAEPPVWPSLEAYVKDQVSKSIKYLGGIVLL
jgi:hypothetical protein